MTQRPGLRAVSATAAVACATAAAPALAQDFDRVAPQAPEARELPALPPPPPDPPLSQDRTVLIPQLRAVLFVGDAASLETEIAPGILPGGIGAPGLPPLETAGFRARIMPFVGQSLTRANLDAISRLAQRAYRDSDRPFVHVSVPPQNVQGGILRILVTEYRIGEISVAGNRFFSSGQILAMGDLDSGEALTLPRLRKALDDYNQNPFLTVSAVTQPGSETGLTDIVLQATDRRPVRVYAGIDNQGVPTLGRWEWYVGFNWGNVFGTGQLLSYQFTRSFEGKYESHSLTDIIPIDADNRLILFGAYATQEPFIADIFDTRGHSGQISGRLAHDLPYSTGYQHSLQIGIDYKRADSNLEFLGLRILDTAVEIFQFPVVYTARIPDGRGITVVENLLVISPGDITGRNTDADIASLVPGAEATYVYDRLSVTRTTNLPEGMSWIVRAMAQVATGNLPYSEQLGAGGLGSVRGYDTNTALGSEGVLLSAEWRSPAFSPLSQMGVTGLADQLQLGLFVDYAWVRQPTRIPDRPRSEELASLGVGLNYSAGRYLDIELSVGTQLIRPTFARDRETRAQLVATISF